MKVPTHETLHSDLLMRQMGKAVFIRKNAGWNFASSFWAGIHNHLAHERPRKKAFPHDISAPPDTWSRSVMPIVL
jgi:hypothetical protein